MRKHTAVGIAYLVLNVICLAICFGSGFLAGYSQSNIEHSKATLAKLAKEEDQRKLDFRQMQLDRALATAEKIVQLEREAARIKSR